MSGVVAAARRLKFLCIWADSSVRNCHKYELLGMLMMYMAQISGVPKVIGEVLLCNTEKHGREYILDSYDHSRTPASSPFGRDATVQHCNRTVARDDIFDSSTSSCTSASCPEAGQSAGAAALGTPTMLCSMAALDSRLHSLPAVGCYLMDRFQDLFVCGFCLCLFDVVN